MLVAERVSGCSHARQRDRRAVPNIEETANSSGQTFCSRRRGWGRREERRRPDRIRDTWVHTRAEGQADAPRVRRDTPSGRPAATGAPSPPNVGQRIVSCPRTGGGGGGGECQRENIREWSRSGPSKGKPRWTMQRYVFNCFSCPYLFMVRSGAGPSKIRPRSGGGEAAAAAPRRRTDPGGRYRSGDIMAVLCGLPAPLRDVLEEVPPPPLHHDTRRRRRPRRRRLMIGVGAAGARTLVRRGKAMRGGLFDARRCAWTRDCAAMGGCATPRSGAPNRANSRNGAQSCAAKRNRASFDARLRNDAQECARVRSGARPHGTRSDTRVLAFFPGLFSRQASRARG